MTPEFRASQLGPLPRRMGRLVQQPAPIHVVHTAAPGPAARPATILASSFGHGDQRRVQDPLAAMTVH